MASNPDQTTFPGGLRPTPSLHIADAETIAPAKRAPADGANPFSIEGYEILDTLGRGGMAIVYKARQKSLQRDVALKVILGGANADREEIARFRIETESIAQLRHPNIVQIYEVSLSHGAPYCSLEFLEGGTLAQRHKVSPLTPEQAAEIVEKLTRAIAAAHKLGIIHRDLKPSNVLLTSNGEPKVTDFGIAKRLDTDVAATKTGAVVGTPGYMAPEQAAGTKTIGPHTDIYGLGAILYELLVGKPPFHAETSLETILMVVSDDPVSPRKINPSIPADLETICLKCLEKDPRRRYLSADDLGDDLLRFIQHEPIHAKPPGFFGRIDRWARLRPALALELTALLFMYLTHLLMLQAGVSGLAGKFHTFATVLALLWAAGACGFQWLSTRTFHALWSTIAWCAFDLVIFTIFLLMADGPSSPLMPVYYLMIGATSLRIQRGLVWPVTFCCILSYLVIALEAHIRRPDFAVDPVKVMFTTIAMLLLALIQHFAVRRIRAALRPEGAKTTV